MRRALFVVPVLLLGVVAGLAAALKLLAPPPRTYPEGPTVITQLREVARLETLDVDVYKKLTFSPDPPPPSESTWQNVVTWAGYTLRDPHGRAILFAKVHLGLDLERLDADHVRVDGDRVWLVLPPVTSAVELLPGETEIIDSNLDSADTAKLLEAAKVGFKRDAEGDRKLKERARSSAERSLRALLVSLGFREVNVVEALPAGRNGS